MRLTPAALIIAVGVTAVGGCTSSGHTPRSGSPAGPSGATSTGTQSSTATPRGGGTSASRSSGGGPSGSAVQAFHRWVDQWSAAQYPQMWHTLASGQQGAVPEKRLAICQRESLQQGGFTSVGYAKTVSQQAADITVAGTTQHVRSTAITAELALDGIDPQTRTLTVHWFAQGNTWRWSFDAAAIKAYRRGRCPGS